MKKNKYLWIKNKNLFPKQIYFQKIMKIIIKYNKEMYKLIHLQNNNFNFIIILTNNNKKINKIVKLMILFYKIFKK